MTFFGWAEPAAPPRGQDPPEPRAPDTSRKDGSDTEDDDPSS